MKLDENTQTSHSSECSLLLPRNPTQVRCAATYPWYLILYSHLEKITSALECVEPLNWRVGYLHFGKSP